MSPTFPVQKQSSLIPLLSGERNCRPSSSRSNNRRQVDGGSFGKEATVEQLPISKGIAGVSMRLEPGATRRAALARHRGRVGFRPRRPRPHHRHRSPAVSPRPTISIPATSGTSRAATATLARMPRRQAVPFHSDLRQRLFLRIRHFQHHRLAGPHASKALLGQEFRSSRSAFDGFPKEEVYFARGRSAREAAVPLQGRETAAPDPQVPHAGPGARIRHLTKADANGGSAPTRFPISKTMTGVDPRARAGRLTRTALASHCRRVAIRHRRPNQRHAVRFARPLSGRNARQGRCRRTFRKATATRSKISATTPAAF